MNKTGSEKSRKIFIKCILSVVEDSGNNPTIYDIELDYEELVVYE